MEKGWPPVDGAGHWGRGFCLPQSTLILGMDVTFIDDVVLSFWQVLQALVSLLLNGDSLEEGFGCCFWTQTSFSPGTPVTCRMAIVAHELKAL